MAVERPVFEEGEILGADRLNAIVDLAEARHGRHGRYLHSWGIATGLGLSTVPRSTDDGAYVEVSVDPGLAIDGSGFELLVTEPILLNTADFDDAAVAPSSPTAEQLEAEEDTWYPVFLVGIDREKRTVQGSRCDRGSASRVVEDVEIRFGRPGDEDGTSVEDALTSGPGSRAPRTAWPILVGHVSWSSELERFRAATLEPKNGRERRYVGVRAAEMISPSAAITLRTAERDVPDRTVLVLDNGQSAAIIGKQRASGAVTPLLTVTAQGNVIAAGQFESPSSVALRVSSGIATDGMVLPLPDGVSASALDDYTLHVSVTPRSSLTQPAQRVLNDEVPVPEVCYVDDELRLHCRIRWIGGGTSVVLPGVADYQIIAVGGGS